MSSVKPRVFISYSSADRLLAKKLHRALETAGCTVWRDETRLETDWSREIALALAYDTDALCLLWTASAAASKWVRHEWLTARALEKLILPCIVSGSPELPEPLRPLHGVVINKRSPALGRVARRVLEAKSFHVRYDYKALPSNSFIPYNPNPEFTGRQAELLELYLKMIGSLSRIGLNQVGTTGMGGIGKTQLATEFALRYSFGFHAVLWMDAADPEKWLSEVVVIARDRLHLTVTDPDGANANRQYLYAFQSYSKNNPNTLVVMDNVGDPKDLNSDKCFFGAGVTPFSLGCDLLFTTRRSFQIPGVLSQSVGVISDKAGYDLLTGNREPSSPEESASAGRIVSAVGNLPLAIVLIAGHIRKIPSVSYADYEAALRANKLASIDRSLLSPEELATRHAGAIRVTLESQWRVIDRDDSRLLFKIASLFPESAMVPKARLGLLASIPAPATPIDRPLDEAFLPLEELNLVEVMGDARTHVRLHPLVREFASGLVPQAERPGFEEAAAESLDVAYSNSSRLESEYRARGAGEVIGDVRTAASLHGCPSRLVLLGRVLERDRNNLDEIHAAAPDQMLQQLHHRARTMGLVEMSETFLQAFKRSSPIAFRTTGVSELEDPGWIRTLRGHENQVRAVEFLAGTSRALSASWDGSLILWDLDTGAPIRSLRGHTAVVNALAVSADGRLAISGSDDKSLCLWDVANGSVLDTLLGHKDYVLAVRVSPDGRYALSSAKDGEVRYWHLQHRSVARVTVYNSTLEAIALHPDGQTFLAPNGKSVVVYDAQGKAIRRLNAHTKEIIAVAFSPDGKQALSAAYDRKLIVWDFASGQARASIDTPEFIYNICFPSTGSHVLTDGDRELVYWDLEKRQPIRTLRGHWKRVQCAAISADGTRVLSSGEYERALIYWDLLSPDVAPAPVKHSSRVADVHLSQDGATCATAGWDKTIIEWDTRAATCKTTRTFTHTAAKVSLNWPLRRALSNNVGGIELWDVETEASIQEVPLHADVHTLLLAPDARRAFVCLSGSSHRGILLTDLEQGKVRPGPSFGDWVHFMSITGDGKRLLIGGDYGLLVLWDLECDREIRRIGPTGQSLSALAIDPSGRRAATGNFSNSELTVWDLEKGVHLHAIRGEYRPTAIALAGSTLVFGDDSGRVHFLKIEEI